MGIFLFYKFLFKKNKINLSGAILFLIFGFNNLKSVVFWDFGFFF